MLFQTSQVEDALYLIATEALSLLPSHFNAGNLIRRHSEAVKQMPGDSVCVSGTKSSVITIDKYVEAAFTVDFEKFIEYPVLRPAYMGPALAKIATRIELDLRALIDEPHSGVVVMEMRVPERLPAHAHVDLTRYFETYVSNSTLGIRVSTVHPTVQASKVTLDLLYGVGLVSLQ